jgi:hypothetical protein
LYSSLLQQTLVITTHAKRLRQTSRYNKFVPERLCIAARHVRCTSDGYLGLSRFFCSNHTRQIATPPFPTVSCSSDVSTADQTSAAPSGLEEGRMQNGIQGQRAYQARPPSALPVAACSERQHHETRPQSHQDRAPYRAPRGDKVSLPTDAGGGFALIIIRPGRGANGLTYPPRRTLL